MSRMLRAQLADGNSKARILIVDSDETLAKFFKIHLNRYFSKVFVTGDAREALEWFKNERFDLVMTDMNLPRLGGFSLLKQIRKLDKDVPLIVMTGLNLSESQRDKVSMCDGFLYKPFSMKEFHLCVQKGLNKKDGKKKTSKDDESYGLFEEESSSKKAG